MSDQQPHQRPPPPVWISLSQARLIFISLHLAFPCPQAWTQDPNHPAARSRLSQWEIPGFQQSGNLWTWSNWFHLFAITVIFVPSHSDNAGINLLQSRNVVLEKWRMFRATSLRPVITFTLAGQLKKDSDCVRMEPIPRKRWPAARMSLLMCVCLSGLHTNRRVEFNKTWWKDGERAKEESIKFWSRSGCFHLRGLLVLGRVLHYESSSSVIDYLHHGYVCFGICWTGFHKKEEGGKKADDGLPLTFGFFLPQKRNHLFSLFLNFLVFCLIVSVTISQNPVPWSR